MSALAQLTKSTNILIYFCEAALYSTKARFFCICKALSFFIIPVACFLISKGKNPHFCKRLLAKTRVFN